MAFSVFLRFDSFTIERPHFKLKLNVVNMNTNFYWHIYVIVAKRTCKVFLNIPHSKICNMIQYLPGFFLLRKFVSLLKFIQIASVFTAFSRTDPFLFPPLFRLAMHSPFLRKASLGNPYPTFSNCMQSDVMSVPFCLTTFRKKQLYTTNTFKVKSKNYFYNNSCFLDNYFLHQKFKNSSKYSCFPFIAS